MSVNQGAGPHQTPSPQAPWFGLPSLGNPEKETSAVEATQSVVLHYNSPDKDRSHGLWVLVKEEHENELGMLYWN